MTDNAVPGDLSAPNNAQPPRTRSRNKTTPHEASPMDEPIDSLEPPLRTTRSKAAATGLVLERVENWGPPPKGAKKRKDANQAIPTAQPDQSISQGGSDQTLQR